MSIASAPEDEGPIGLDIAGSPSRNRRTLWRTCCGSSRPAIACTCARSRRCVHPMDAVGADDSRIRVMVAAGTGSAPFMSMVRSETRRNPQVDLSKSVLLHGASYPADFGYRQELLELSRPTVEYWGTVSRPNAAPHWAGDIGRVESFFVPGRMPDLEHRLGLAAGDFTPRADLRLRGDKNDRRGAHAVARPRVRPARSADPRALGVPPDVTTACSTSCTTPRQ